MRNALYGFLMLMLLIAALWGCSEAPTVQQGTKVKIHYVGTLDDGSVFDSSTAERPLEFVAGSGQMIKGFDEGVMGMKVGEKKDITLTPEDGYGMPDPNRVMEIDRTQFPPDLELVAGQELAGMGPFPVKVVAVTDSTVTIDANHPMAGKTLHFNITLLEIGPAEEKPATEGETGGEG